MKILNNLRSYDVDLIELGVQSFDPEVLKASKRGHTAEETYNACDMIKRHDFELGIQLMAGLPGDTKEKAIRSAECAANIGPSTARIYPTVVLEGTELCKMLRNGDYKALSEKDAVEITKEMYKILHAAGINIIRVGLKSTDNITNYSDLGGGYHPAFRQLVEGAIALEKMESQLARLIPSNIGVPNTANYALPYAGRHMTFVSNSKSFPAMIGHKACNKNKIAGKYKCFDISYKEDNSLPDYTYELREKLCVC